MVLLPAALALASACLAQESEPDDHTAQGFGLYFDTLAPIDALAISAQVDLQARAASEIMGEDVEALWFELGDDISLTLTNECLNDCQWAGYTDLPGWVVIWYPDDLDCVAESAVSHELTHIALLLLDGDPDASHTLDWAWSGPGSIVEYANRSGRWEICGRP